MIAISTELLASESPGASAVVESFVQLGVPLEQLIVKSTAAEPLQPVSPLVALKVKVCVAAGPLYDAGAILLIVGALGAQTAHEALHSAAESGGDPVWQQAGVAPLHGIVCTQLWLQE